MCFRRNVSAPRERSHVSRPGVGCAGARDQATLHEEANIAAQVGQLIPCADVHVRAFIEARSDRMVSSDSIWNFEKLPA
jgi:hypothetical protein